MSDANIGVEVLKNPEDIVDELIEYRNEKVEKEINMPIQYKVQTVVSDQVPENVFYRFFADSSLEMTPKPPSRIPDVQDVAEIVSHTLNVETPIEAKPKYISMHEPILDNASQILEDEDYTNTTVQEVFASGRTVETTLEKLEEKGLKTKIHIKDTPPNSSTKGLNPYLTYNAIDQSFYPKIRNNRNKDQEKIQEADQELEELIEQFDL